MIGIGVVYAAYKKTIVTDILPKFRPKHILLPPVITADCTCLSTFCFSLSKFFGPALEPNLLRKDRQLTYGPVGLCPDMKHKRKKSSKHERKHKKKLLERAGRREKKAKKRLKHLTMASGFQSTSTRPLRSSHASDDDDDEIIVVYDKLNETNGDVNPRRKQDVHEVRVIQPNYGNVHDIPLPPETFVSPLRMGFNQKPKIECIRLEDIPLPPSPDSYDSPEIEMDAKVLKKYVKEFRKWEQTDLGKTLLHQDGTPTVKLQDHESFTIMSYNVLAQQLLEDHKYLYRRHDIRALTWEFRSKILLKEIKDADADVLCLQEVQANHLDSFYSKLKDLGYEGIFKRRSSEHSDGCAIYYKSDKFSLIESTSVEYFQDYLNSFCILDRNNVAIIAKLALNNSNGRENHVVVATTHLLYNPRRHDIKLAQSQVLLAELDRVSFIGIDPINGRPKYLPTIVTGDFNLQPETAVYRFLREGFLSYAALTARSLTFPSYGQAHQEFLLPYELQISNYCQHLGLILHRLKQANNCFLDKDADVSKVTKLYNSERYKTIAHYIKAQAKIPLLYEEDFYGRSEKGCLRHALNLQSVYPHERQSTTSKRMTREATTHQDDWVTVDYIFYSGNWNQESRCAEEGRLKLLSRYTLPTCGECQQLKSIPNLVCGSDHLSLMARFLLSS